MHSLVQLSLALCLGVVLTACGEDSVDLSARLVLPPGSEATEILFDNSGQIQAGTTVRFLYSYRGISSLGNIIIPSTAAPTFSESDGQRFFNWHKANGPGIPVSGGANLEISLQAVPLDRRDFQMAIEFMQDFDGEVRTVAYGCVLGPGSDRASKAYLESVFAAGVVIYAGRTCGRCSPTIRESQFTSCDHPAFTLANFESGNADNFPQQCGAYAEVARPDSCQ